MVSRIGTLHEKRDEILNVQWQIEDFLSLYGTTDPCYDSHTFRFSDSSWYLRIFPYGRDIEDWIGLYVLRSEESSGDIVAYQCGILKSDGTLRLEKNVTWEFDENRGYGDKHFLRRSELLQQRSELLTSGALTIVCRLKKPSPPQELNTMSAGLKDILASKKLSDVTIHVGQQVFEAHKVILAVSSPVFADMFDQDMSEKHSGTVNIEDCDPETFKDFLYFLYTSVADITERNVFHLYEAAHKYRVAVLMSYCVAFIMENASVDNICDVAALEDLYSNSDLKHFCSLFFQNNSQSILLTSKWESLTKENHVLATKLLKRIAPK